jgi:hypothetical protein
MLKVLGRNFLQAFPIPYRGRVDADIESAELSQNQIDRAPCKRFVLDCAVDNHRFGTFASQFSLERFSIF